MAPAYAHLASLAEAATIEKGCEYETEKGSAGLPPSFPPSLHNLTPLYTSRLPLAWSIFVFFLSLDGGGQGATPCLSLWVCGWSLGREGNWG